MVSAAGFEQDIKSTCDNDGHYSRRFPKINVLIDCRCQKRYRGVDISPTAGKQVVCQNIRIRGMDSEYTLVLIDGRRQNSTGDITPNGFGESNNSFIPPISAIERIEVMRPCINIIWLWRHRWCSQHYYAVKVSNEWTGAVTLEGTLLPNSSDFGNQRSEMHMFTGPFYSKPPWYPIKRPKLNEINQT